MSMPVLPVIMACCGSVVGLIELSTFIYLLACKIAMIRENRKMTIDFQVVVKTDVKRWHISFGCQLDTNKSHLGKENVS